MPDAHGKLTPEELRKRWETPLGQAFRDEIIMQLKSSVTNNTVDWENLSTEIDEDRLEWTNNIDLKEKKQYDWKKFDGVKELEDCRIPFADLRGINLSGIGLKCPRLSSIHMEWAVLVQVSFDNADFSYTRLDNAILCFAHLTSAVFTYSFLINADLSSAWLCNTDFRNAHLNGADLNNAHLEKTLLNGTHLEGADLRNVKLRDADLHRAHFVLKTWLMRVMELTPTSIVIKVLAILAGGTINATKLRGAEITKMNLEGDPILYRDLLDEQYLDEFAEKHKFLYPFWLLTSNCGRWTSLVFGWAMIVGVLFAFVFSDFSSPTWLPTCLRDLLDLFDPYFTYNGKPQTMWWQPFYLSFVTMTTLGLASAEPANTAAFLWHLAQNLIGYVLFGYLISVLGSKLTRRSA